MIITDVPVSICQVVLAALSPRQERGTPCLAESTSRDIRKQALAEQFVCGHWKGREQDTTCACKARSTAREQGTALSAAGATELALQWDEADKTLHV